MNFVYLDRTSHEALVKLDVFSRDNESLDTELLRKLLTLHLENLLDLPVVCIHLHLDGILIFGIQHKAIRHDQQMVCAFVLLVEEILVVSSFMLFEENLDFMIVADPGAADGILGRRIDIRDALCNRARLVGALEDRFGLHQSLWCYREELLLCGHFLV